VVSGQFDHGLADRWQTELFHEVPGEAQGARAACRGRFRWCARSPATSWHPEGNRPTGPRGAQVPGSHPTNVSSAAGNRNRPEITNDAATSVLSAHRGRPRPRVAMMFRFTSLVPPATV
jgi:hypothetical protein